MNQTLIDILGASRALLLKALRLPRLGLLLLVPLALAGCMEGNRLAFAPPGESVSRPVDSRGRSLTAVFGDGQLILAAPSGFCFDAEMEQHTGSGGFALLARCEKMGTFGRLRGKDGAMLTATVGAVSADTPAPSTEALRSAFTEARSAARVLETRGDGDIPLIKLHMASHSAKGASGTHWRGAFLVHGHLVSVALYAPEGSGYLGERGARLIREFVQATRNATLLAETAAPTETAPQRTLRPQDRSGAVLAQAAAAPQE